MDTEIAKLRGALHDAEELIKAFCPGPGDAWKTRNANILTR